MKNKKNNYKNQSSTQEATNSLSTSNKNIISDYDGSYTGVPIDDKFSKPIQDADDL